MTNQAPTALLREWFGDEFSDRDARLVSYVLLEEFIESSHTDWSKTAPTEAIASKFAARVAALSEKQLGFLLCHSGYIPEQYGADSSQETLYSKLIEVLVAEWARRLGFDLTTMPTQKSSVEDVTIADKNYVIVCDAKSYRLGRSQKAPNVKDALKQGDIAKWLERYPESKRLGGIVTFPSQHDWTNGSDVYLYLTDNKSPVAMLFYEHLSFMMLDGRDKEDVVSFFLKHKEHFPRPISKREGNRAHYFTIAHRLVISKDRKEWSRFDAAADFVIRERVSFAIERLHDHLNQVASEAKAEVAALDEEALRVQLVTAKVALKSQHLSRQIENIRAFRATL